MVIKMRLSTLTKINDILQAKTDNHYYRSESEDYNKIIDVKIQIDFSIMIKRRHIEFVLLLLQKLKNEVQDYSLFLQKESYSIESSGTKLVYSLLLDAAEIMDISLQYNQILQIMQFGEPFINMENVKILFSKKGIVDYNKTHKKLVAYILDHSSYFQSTYINNWPINLDYRLYVQNQMNLCTTDTIINYLRPKEIEINFLKPKITMAELKNILLGLCYELFSVHFTWGTKRRLRPLATSRRFYQNLERNKVIKDNVIS